MSEKIATVLMVVFVLIHMWIGEEVFGLTLIQILVVYCINGAIVGLVQVFIHREYLRLSKIFDESSEVRYSYFEESSGIHYSNTTNPLTKYGLELKARIQSLDAYHNMVHYILGLGFFLPYVFVQMIGVIILDWHYERIKKQK